MLDCELYLPEAWTNDRKRWRRAEIPRTRRLATKPQLAKCMLAQVLATSVPAAWVTCDCIYG